MTSYHPAHIAERMNLRTIYGLPQEITRFDVNIVEPSALPAPPGSRQGRLTMRERLKLLGTSCPILFERRQP